MICKRWGEKHGEVGRKLPQKWGEIIKSREKTCSGREKSINAKQGVKSRRISPLGV